jgi:osmotically-inducible protein OsmY
VIRNTPTFFGHGHPTALNKHHLFSYWSNFMFKQSRNLLLASGIALALAGGVASAGTASQEVTEARQETQIWTTYALSPYLRANDLQVSVHDGKATLTGKVEESVNKELAEQIALGVNGVKHVDNQIVIQADYSPPAQSAERSFGEVIDDATITSQVKSKFLWSKNTEGFATNVTTKRGKVSLVGTADSAAAKDLAGQMALNTRGVMSVDNQLVVKAPKESVAKTATEEAGHDMTDGWITTKVKSTYMYSTNVNGSDISVNTDKGVVALSGKVDSGAERALAIELAQNVRGVKSVNSKALTL